MKHCVKCTIYILLFVLCYKFPIQLVTANSEDGKVASASASVVVSENISSSSSSEEKNEPTNLDSNSIVNSDSVLEPSDDVQTPFNDLNNNDNLDNSNTHVFAEIASQNSGVANEITTGQPVVITLSDPATKELKQRADIPTIVPSQNEEVPFKNNTQDTTLHIETQDNATEEEKDKSDVNNLSNQQTDKIVIEVPIVPKNLTDEKTEEIPSFSEWTQKRLEEAEKNKEQVNTSTQNQVVNGKQGSGAKFRWKNYASPDCGAKVVAANPEAVSASAILSPSRDEYKLNTCTSRIWFIVELCEAIQAKKIDLANYELFSSSPKDFSVSVSDRFPSRDWSNVGQFTAKDERDIQSFELHPHLFGKYIKVEVKSHYGSEHFCPISLFRVYGTSEFEVLQKEDAAHDNRLEEDDDDDDETLDTESKHASKNLLSSATDVVISMVKKAAEVLGNKNNNKSDTSHIKNNESVKYSPLISSCTSPSHFVVCNNCSDLLFGQVYELMSCKSVQIRNLVSIPIISKALVHSNECKRFGFDFRNYQHNSTLNSCADFIKSFFPLQYLGAMCNTIAISENKVLLNISLQYPNVTQNLTSSDEKLVNIQTSEPHAIKPETNEVTVEEKLNEVEPTDALKLENTDGDTIKASCSTDISYTSQIKPTKALTSDLDLSHSNTDFSTESNEDVKVVMPTESVVVQPSETVEKVPENVGSEQIENGMDGFGETESITESVEGLKDNLDNFMEFNVENNQNSGQASATTATPQGQKESVFLRLSNRIKALERNMSLSSQYLEELSKRYKKQVEEMQRLLEKTILLVNEEGKRQEERTMQLQKQLDTFAAAIQTSYWLFFIVIILIGVFTFCWKPNTPKPPPPNKENVVEIHRRKSIDVVTHNTITKKRRRPSDQALKIVRSSAWVNEQDKRLNKERRKKNKRNKLNSVDNRGDSFNPRRTSSKIWNKSDINGREWIVEENKGIEDIPFVLEESEHSALEPLPLQNDISKIEAPSFMQTATTSRVQRLSSQNGPVVTLNGNNPNEVYRKSTSLDETNRRKSPAPSVNGNNSTGSADEPTAKKEKKGFKKLFRRVF